MMSEPNPVLCECYGCGQTMGCWKPGNCEGLCSCVHCKKQEEPKMILTLAQAIDDYLAACDQVFQTNRAHEVAADALSKARNNHADAVARKEHTKGVMHKMIDAAAEAEG